MGILKGASLDGKNAFVLRFLTFIEKYMSLRVEPPLGEIAKDVALQGGVGGPRHFYYSTGCPSRAARGWSRGRVLVLVLVLVPGRALREGGGGSHRFSRRTG